MRKSVFGLILLCLFTTSALAQNSRIINGTQVPTDDAQWQYIISLQTSYGYHFCGGSLIAPQWVLTASHCQPSTSHQVGVKSYALNATTVFAIEATYTHPQFNSTTLDNDVALIKLSQPVSGVTPVIVDAAHPLTADTPSWVAGWGNTSTTGSVYPNDLMEVPVPIVDFTTCNSAIAYNGQLTTNMICAGYMSGVYDSCQGDSGGPLIVDVNGSWTQIGIVSWGYACAAANYPGVYTRVQNFRSWIETYTGLLPAAYSTSAPAFSPALINYLLN